MSDKKSIIISKEVHYKAKIRAAILEMNMKGYIESLIKADLEANSNETATKTATNKK